MQSLSKIDSHIEGVANIDGHGFRCAHKKIDFKSADLNLIYAEMLDKKILPIAIDHFKRFDQSSKLVVLVTVLALYDASYSLDRNKKHDIGILGLSAGDVALPSNRVYFQDYLNSGKKSGRASLFLYTLPTTCLAEAAIYLGLQGPITSIGINEGQSKMIQLQENVMLRSNNMKGLLVVHVKDGSASCRFVKKGDSHG